MPEPSDSDTEVVPQPAQSRGRSARQRPVGPAPPAALFRDLSDAEGKADLPGAVASEDDAAVATAKVVKKDRSRSRPKPDRPGGPPPPEAFGLLPEHMRIAGPAMAAPGAGKKRERAAPSGPPPPEAFGALPDHMRVEGPRASQSPPRARRPAPAGPPPDRPPSPLAAVAAEIEAKRHAEELERIAAEEARLAQERAEKAARKAALEAEVEEKIRLEREERERKAKEDADQSVAKLLADLEAERAAAELEAIRKAEAEAAELERLRVEAEARQQKEREEKEAQERAELEAAEAKKRRKQFGPTIPPGDPPKPVPFDTSLIPRGKLLFTIDRVVGVGPGTGGLNGKINAKTVGNCYLIFELNMGTARVQSKSDMYKQVVISDFEPPRNASPILPMVINEGVPAPLMPHEMPDDEKAQLPPILFYSVWMPGGVVSSDVLVAEGQVPASSFFQTTMGDPNDKEVAQKQAEGIDITLPLKAPRSANGQSQQGQTAATVFAYIAGNVRFVEGRAGILSVTVHEGRNLNNKEVFNQQDPYIQLQLGGSKVRGQTVQEGGINPFFNDEELLLWIDHSISVAQIPLKLTVWDAEALGSAELIGGVDVTLASWIADYDVHEDIVEIFFMQGKGAKAVRKSAGTLVVTRRFFPAGELIVKVVEGKNLAVTDVAGGADSYCKLHLEGRVRSFDVKTKIDSVSGPNPVWNQMFVFDVVDHADLQLSVWDWDRITKDDLVGEVTIDLGALFKNGVRDAWVPIKLQGEWGGFDHRGNIKLECDFAGPPKIAYPQLRHDKAVFDDTVRLSRRGPSQNELDSAERARQEVQKRIDAEREQATKEMAGGEFTDNEIKQAFDMIDLDKNLAISAAELRHVLTCMGELITDKEIDMMLKMCDHDGDGVVAYFEFYQMAKASNPGDPEWRPHSEEEYRTKRSGLREGQPKPPPVVVYDAAGNPIDVIDAADDAESRRKAMMRAVDMAKKQEKKALCERFVDKLELRLPELQRCFKRFMKMRSFNSGRVTFEEMCEIFDVEEANEYRDVFTLFVDTTNDNKSLIGKCNIRELLLALNNFTGATKPQRVNFCFFLFDADQSGEIAVSELIEILQASHLSRDAEAIKKKADSILVQADKDGSGTVSLEEFIVIANRFPNILFPNYSVDSEALLRGAPEAVNAGKAGVKPAVRKKKKNRDEEDEFGAI